MPELDAYLAGFNITKYLQLDGYVLTHITGSHNTIQRFKEYQYSIQLLFTPTEGAHDYDALLRDLTQLTSGKRIIDSAFGNPYECDFGTPSIKSILNDGQVIIVTVGHSYRVSK